MFCRSLGSAVGRRHGNPVAVQYESSRKIVRPHDNIRKLNDLALVLHFGRCLSGHREPERPPAEHSKKYTHERIVGRDGSILVNPSFLDHRPILAVVRKKLRFP